MSCLELSILIAAVHVQADTGIRYSYRTCIRAVLCITTGRKQLSVCVKTSKRQNHGAKGVKPWSNRLPSLLPLQMDAVSLARQASVRFHRIRHIKLHLQQAGGFPDQSSPASLFQPPVLHVPRPGLWGPLGVGRRPAWRTIKPCGRRGLLFEAHGRPWTLGRQ